MEQKFLVDLELLNGIATYLSKRPYIEVAGFMGSLAALKPVELPLEPSVPDDRYPEERAEYD